MNPANTRTAITYIFISKDIVPEAIVVNLVQPDKIFPFGVIFATYGQALGRNWNNPYLYKNESYPPLRYDKFSLWYYLTTALYDASVFPAKSTDTNISFFIYNLYKFLVARLPAKLHNDLLFKYYFSFVLNSTTFLCENK